MLEILNFEAASVKLSGVAVAAAVTVVTAFAKVLGKKLLSTPQRSCDNVQDPANLAVWILNH